MTDRRKAQQPFSGPERRTVGRPRIPEEQRQQTVHVKLPPDVHDAVCRIALRRGLAVNAVLRVIIERAFRTGELA